MIAGFCRAYDENPRLFRFLLFVQHDQLGKLAADAPTPVEAVRMVIARGIASASSRRRTPTSPRRSSSASCCNRSSSPRTGVLPSDMGSMRERLVAAAWAAVTTV